MAIRVNQILLVIGTTAALQIAAGEPLTYRLQHYQADPLRPSVSLAAYQNSFHDFTENAFVLKFDVNRELKHFRDSLGDFESIGLFGTDGWDTVEIVIDYTTDTWSVSLNGGTPVADLPFRNDGDYETARSLLISPSVGQMTGYTDNVEVYIGAVPTVGVPGDYNGNNAVDAADYVLWRNGGPLQNEVDTPSVVDAQDYDAWRARFGNTGGSGSLAGPAAVPEPASAPLALVIAMSRTTRARVSFRPVKRRN
jgi:hypothetical protein